MSLVRRDSQSLQVRKLRNYSLSLVGFFLLLTSWSLASPIGSSPDDDFHLASIYCGNGLRTDLCEKSKSISFDATNNPVRLVPADVYKFYDCAYQKNLEKCQDNSDSKTLLPTSRLNTMSFYPPVFYYISSFFASIDVQRTGIILRMFNCLLATFLLLLTLSGATKEQVTVSLSTIAFSTVPLGLFIISSNNPSSWSIACVIFFVLNLAKLISNTEQQSATKVALILTLLLGIGARIDASVYIGILGVIFVLLNLNKLTGPIQKFLRSLTLIGLGWTTSMLLTSRQYQMGLQSIVASNEKTSIWKNLIQSPEVLFAIFGIGRTRSSGWQNLAYLGRFNVPIPLAVSFLMIVLLLAITIDTLLRADKTARLLIVAALVLNLAVVNWYLLRWHTTVGEVIQPRYLLPGMSIWIFLVIRTNLRTSQDKRHRFLLAIYIGTLGVCNSLSLYACLTYYRSGSISDRMSIPIANHWPYGAQNVGLIIWIIGSLAFFMFMSPVFSEVTQVRLTSKKWF